MKQVPVTTCLLLDIGGVLLTDGWDHHSRGGDFHSFCPSWRLIPALCNAMVMLPTSTWPGRNAQVAR